MKVIVAGSRHLGHEPVFEAIALALDEGWAFDEVVTGGCRGPDQIAHEAAQRKGVPTTVFEADWETHGKAAGPKRNRTMADYADALVAVWDGESSGTAHMIQEAKRRDLSVLVYRNPGSWSIRG